MLFTLDVSPVPLDSKSVHEPHVEWLVATVEHGAEAQPTLENYNDLERETVDG